MTWIEPELVVHQSAKELLLAFWSSTDVDLGDIEKSTMGGFTPDGKQVSMTFQQNVEAIERMGYWGFADCPKHKVHIWVGEKVSPAETIFLLGHELGHLLGKPHDDELMEEERADEYGVAAQVAWKWLTQLKK